MLNFDNRLRAADGGELGLGVATILATKHLSFSVSQ
jgi:hypothetical protein